jgi:hypothetical protein
MFVWTLSPACGPPAYGPQRLWREIKHIMKIAQTVDGIQGSMEKLAEGACVLLCRHAPPRLFCFRRYA